MDILDVPLPELSVRVDIAPTAFFDRCEAIARVRGWRYDRRRAYAGPGFDQLNLFIGAPGAKYPMLRMVATPHGGKRLSLDVVDDWETRPLAYDEYLSRAKAAYGMLLRVYNREHSTRFRIGVPRRPERLDLKTLNCGKISYAAERLGGLTRILAIGAGDARQRLASAFWSFHVIRPEDLPAPLAKHLAWVYKQITRREPRHRWEGAVEASVSTMKNATAAKILERLVDVADAVALLDKHCRRRRGFPH